MGEEENNMSRKYNTVFRNMTHKITHELLFPFPENNINWLSKTGIFFM